MIDFKRFVSFILDRKYYGKLDEISNLSYIHPNGFCKLVFPPMNQGAIESRIHIWPDGGGATDIHNHTSFFSSLVISGEIIEEKYDIHKSGSKFLYKCGERDSCGVVKLKKMHSASVTLKSRKLIQSGEMYDISMNEFHRIVRPDNGLIVTMVHQFQKKRNNSFVIKSDKIDEKELILKNPSMNSSDALSYLNVCYDILK